MRDYKKLDVWENSYKLTLDVYKLTKSFPKDELYGIVSQMRRAASSIPANIAEGASKSSEKGFGRFLQIAFGSSSELEVFISLSKDLGYLNEIEEISNDLIHIKRQLYNLIKTLNK